MPVKILHLITSLNTGGAELWLWRLLKGLPKDRFESRVVCLIPLGAVADRISDLGIPVLSLNMLPGRPSLKGFWNLFQILKNWKPDILQTWLYHADLLGVIAGKLSGVPRIAWNVRSSTINFANYRVLSGWVAWLCARISGVPDAVVVNSYAGQQVHADYGYHPRKWEYIPNGVDLEYFKLNLEEGRALRGELNIPANVPVIGMAARFDPQKDYLSLVKAIFCVRETYPESFLVLCGDGVAWDNDMLVGWLNAFGEPARTRLLSRRDDLRAFYSMLDVFVLSSSYGEGFPNVVAEAMSCECPCVATDVGDTAFLLGETGYVVPPQDPESLAEAIVAVLRLDQQERKILGDKSRNRIRQEFSWEIAVERYCRLYDQLAAQ